MLQCSQYHPVLEQYSAFFPAFLPYFSKHAHYRVTLFTLFLVELHKAVRLFVGCLLNRLIPPPNRCPSPLSLRDISPHCGESPITREAYRLHLLRPPCKKRGGKRRSRRGGLHGPHTQKTAPVRRQALFGVKHYYFFGTRRSLPPIYGCKALGTSTLPSACKLFSRKAMSILGGATTVLFRVWAR